MQYNAIFKTVVKTDRLCVKKSGAPDINEDDDEVIDLEDEEPAALLVEPEAATIPVFPLEMHPRAKRNNNSIPGALPQFTIKNITCTLL